MLSRITYAQFREWMIYAGMEPFGEERADLRSGIVSCVMANAFRTKGGRVFRPADFMPQFGARKPRKTSAEIMTVLKASFAAAKACGRKGLR